jgi:hypothetical protein
MKLQAVCHILNLFPQRLFSGFGNEAVHYIGVGLGVKGFFKDFLNGLVFDDGGQGRRGRPDRFPEPVRSSVLHSA